MSTLKHRILGVVILGLVSGMAACTAKSHGVVRVPRNTYDQVFGASLAAAQEAEFTITAQDRETGTIGAEKHLSSIEGGNLRMTVHLTEASPGVKVVATVAPTSGQLAEGEKPCKCHVKRFVEALEKRVPEVELVTIK